MPKLRVETLFSPQGEFLPRIDTHVIHNICKNDFVKRNTFFQSLTAFYKKHGKSKKSKTTTSSNTAEVARGGSSSSSGPLHHTCLICNNSDVFSILITWCEV